eukprot:COSAG04_NODE_617_length_11897_cov_27.308696_10_plen_70_part_00
MRADFSVVCFSFFLLAYLVHSEPIGVWSVACHGQNLASSTGYDNVAYQGFSWDPTYVHEAVQWVRSLSI